jgi:hypothetical protein
MREDVMNVMIASMVVLLVIAVAVILIGAVARREAKAGRANDGRARDEDVLLI